MKKIYLLLLTLSAVFTLRSQPFVQINDPVWANYLTTNYPTCMNGNTLNGGCGAPLTSVSTLTLSGMGLTDITGIKYFTNLWMLNVSNNSLTSLPMLPANIYSLVANNNSISTIQNFPFFCQYVYLQNNQLSSLPATGTPSGLTLFCGGNNITCFGPFPANSQTIDLLPNPFVCLPNHVPAAMNSTLLATPICSVGNIFNCPGTNAISGSYYNDVNSNCIRDNGDVSLSGIGVKLYNMTGSVISQYYASNSYSYGLSAPVGTYTVRIDSAGLPVQPQCPSPAWDSVNIVLSGGNPSVNNVNFNFQCFPGFDIGCTSRWLQGAIFPGTYHYMRPNVTNLGNFPGLNCVTNFSAQVVVSLSGPIASITAAPNALIPIISGNTATYSIAGFSTITNPYTQFGLSVTTATNAQIGQSICVTVVVTPTAGDNMVGNNTYTFCYPVGNSYDPNEKHTWPEEVAPGYTGWFDYQIHFQNLGNAPANNIHILDTMDNNLDLSSFRIVSSTHNYNMVMNGNIANFVFPNIMLADSMSDPIGSKAMIHYRCKPKPGMVSGTKIKNRGHIYFDFNPAVVTNQSINTFTLTTGLSEYNVNSNAIVYPNPTKSILNVKFENALERSAIVYDVLGKEMMRSNHDSNLISIPTNELSSGIYMLKISSKEGNAVYRVVVEK
jgi:uncharacterized repeat protein (TIGR01451 family)